MALTKLWVDTHRPKKLSDLVFSSEQERKIFETYVANGSIPNLMILGTQGTGKTSLSLVLMNELNVDRADVMKINCSDEKIDAVRDKVKTFAYTMPMGEFKVVRLEEIDYLSPDAQGLLRVLIEEVSESCRFIATANYANKILPALKDRFQLFEFNKPHFDDVLIKMAEVLEQERIAFEVDDLEKVVAAGYPSLRKIITLMEKGSTTGTLTLNAEAVSADWKLQLLPLLEAGDLKTARKVVCEGATKEELVDVYRFLYDNVHRIKKLKGKDDQAVVLIAQYQYQHAFVADGEPQIAALFIELGAL